MIVDIECSLCNGEGKVIGISPNRQSRFVGHEDTDPSDYFEECAKCVGTGIVAYDPVEDCE